MWLHSVACRAARSTCACTRSPASIAPRSGTSATHLVVAEPKHVVDPRPAVAVGALDVAGVGHLATAGRRRTATRPASRARVRPRPSTHRPSSRCRSSRSRGTRSRTPPAPASASACSRSLAAGPRPARPTRPRPLLVHQPSNPSSSTPRSCSATSSQRQVDREAVGVVQQERVRGGDPLVAGSTARSISSSSRSSPCSSVRPKLSSSAASHSGSARAARRARGYSPPISSVTSPRSGQEARLERERRGPAGSRGA